MDEFPLSRVQDAQLEEKDLSGIAQHAFAPRDCYRVVLICTDGTRVPFNPMFDVDKPSQQKVVSAVQAFLASRSTQV
jgi:hypothetical protein